VAGPVDALIVGPLVVLLLPRGVFCESLVNFLHRGKVGHTGAADDPDGEADYGEIFRIKLLIIYLFNFYH
jgi:hypothetical protein